MLPAAHRLKGDRNFKLLMKRGRTIFSRCLTLRSAPNNKPLTRFAFVVSTRISKKAVERNRVKRRLRDIVRHELGQIKPGYDILIAAKKNTLDADYPTLQSEVRFLLSKARLLNAHDTKHRSQATKFV